MGVGRSRFETTSPGDVDKNLRWALHEQMKWEMRSSSAQEVLDNTAAKAPPAGNTSGVTGMGVSVPVTLAVEKDAAAKQGFDVLPPVQVVDSTLTSADIDELERTREVLSLIAEVIRMRGGQSAIEKHQKQGYNTLLTLRPSDSHSASKSFAAAATASISTSHSTTASAMRQQVGEPHPISDLYPDSTKQKKEIVSKYLFINSLLSKLVQSSLYCFKLRAKEEMLRNHLKKVHKEHKDPGGKPTANTIARLSVSADETLKVLECALANWDKARVTINWLTVDYELNYALHRLEVQSARMKAWRDKLRHESDEEKKISEIDHTLYQLEARKSDLELELQVNEREALFIGLNYLDTNYNGQLENKEALNMPENIKTLLDVQDSKGLSHAKLEKSINKLLSSLDESLHELRRLQADNVRISALNPLPDAEHVRMLNNQDAMLQRQKLVESDSTLLKQVYDFFHVSFANSVFQTLEGHASQASAPHSADVELLFTDLRDVGSELYADPFDTSSTHGSPILSSAASLSSSSRLSDPEEAKSS